MVDPIAAVDQESVAICPLPRTYLVRVPPLARILTSTLALAPGTRLGVYEITAQIGEGGMGAVYRAIDTSPSRQVATKVLPDAFARDGERLARFEREEASGRSPRRAASIPSGGPTARNCTSSTRRAR